MVLYGLVEVSCWMVGHGFLVLGVVVLGFKVLVLIWIGFGFLHYTGP